MFFFFKKRKTWVPFIVIVLRVCVSFCANCSFFFLSHDVLMYFYIYLYCIFFHWGVYSVSLSFLQVYCKIADFRFILSLKVHSVLIAFFSSFSSSYTLCIVVVQKLYVNFLFSCLSYPLSHCVLFLFYILKRNHFVFLFSNFFNFFFCSSFVWF